ncbi:MAG: HAD family hydrolase [Bacteroidota bacterium]|nr:HAD family hydrolase [Bacteroidota bacterium]
MIKHIIWDYNGTLLDDVRYCVDIMNEMLRIRHLPELTLARYREIFDFPVKNYYQAAGIDFEKESFEQAGTEFIEKYNAGVAGLHLIPGTKQVLSELRKAGYRQYILSARKEADLLQELRQFGIEQYFDKVAGLTNHYASGKVQRAEGLLKEIGEIPDRTVLIGDTVHDCEVAQAIGADSILITTGHQNANRLSKCNVPVAKTFDDLKALLF